MVQDIKCQVDSAISLCTCPQSNHGDSLGWGKVQELVQGLTWYSQLDKLVCQTNYGIWTTGIEKTEGGLDSGQSTSVLQGVHCFHHWDCPVVRRTLLYHICAPKHHYRPRRRVDHLRNFSGFIPGHHQSFDYNQTFRKGTLVLDRFGYYCITGVPTGIELSTFGTLFFGHRKLMDIAMLSRNIV